MATALFASKTLPFISNPSLWAACTNSSLKFGPMNESNHRRPISFDLGALNGNIDSSKGSNQESFALIFLSN
jgi:hypothetical protein